MAVNNPPLGAGDHLFIEILYSSIKFELGRGEREGRVIRDVAWGVLLASMLVAASLLSIGGQAMVQSAMAPIIGLSWIFLLLMLEWYHTRVHRLYALRLALIRDGVLYIEKGERPEYIEEDLVKYLPPGASKLNHEMGFPIKSLSMAHQDAHKVLQAFTQNLNWG